jgi:hypothetical protein
VLLFEKSKVPYRSLFKLGIGNHMIKDLPTEEQDPRNSFMNLNGANVNFSVFFDEEYDQERKWLAYEGEDLNTQVVNRVN